jgi:hypothetical protein
MTKKLVIEVNEEFFKNLKKQKAQIIEILSSDSISSEKTSELEGVLNFFDYIQDQAVDELGFEKKLVFNLESENEQSS